MMKLNSLKLFIGVCLLFLITIAGTTSAFAIDCKPFVNTQGSHGPLSKYTGYECDTPNQYNQVTSCIGTSGSMYQVTYCNGNGCTETYPEEGDKAPALCNRPAQKQTGLTKVFGEILPPIPIQHIGFGALGINRILSLLIQLIYVVASVIAVFMVLISALQWITSGGDKEGVSKARARLTYTIIGIVLLSLAFVFLNILGYITGFTFFQGQADFSDKKVEITCTNNSCGGSGACTVPQVCKKIPDKNDCSCQNP